MLFIRYSPFKILKIIIKNLKKKLNSKIEKEKEKNLDDINFQKDNKKIVINLLSEQETNSNELVETDFSKSVKSNKSVEIKKNKKSETKRNIASIIKKKLFKSQKNDLLMVNNFSNVQKIKSHKFEFKNDTTKKSINNLKKDRPKLKKNKSSSRHSISLISQKVNILS